MGYYNKGVCLELPVVLLTNLCSQPLFVQHDVHFQDTDRGGIQNVGEEIHAGVTVRNAFLHVL